LTRVKVKNNAFRIFDPRAEIGEVPLLNFGISAEVELVNFSVPVVDSKKVTRFRIISDAGEIAFHRRHVISVHQREARQVWYGEPFRPDRRRFHRRNKYSLKKCNVRAKDCHGGDDQPRRRKKNRLWHCSNVDEQTPVKTFPFRALVRFSRARASYREKYAGSSPLSSC